MSNTAFSPSTQATVSPETVKLAIRSRFNPIRGLTPQLLSTQLDSFNAGWVSWCALTWDAIERRDDLLKGVASKRKKDVARLNWEVLPIDESPEAAAHAETLKEFYNHIRAVNALDENDRGGMNLLVRQMMDSVGKKYAVHEIVWQPAGSSPSCDSLSAEFRFVPLWFFENRTGRLRYVEIFGGADGRPLEEGNWMITCGDGLMEACSVAWMFKQLPLKDWVAYSEKFGMPGVVGHTPSAKGSDAGNAMVNAVTNFGQDWSCVIFGDEGAGKIELVETKGGASNLPMPPLVERMDRAMSALWRGSDLSTMSADNKGASVQGDETDILREDDAANISQTLNDQVDRYVIAQVHGETKCLAYIKIIVPEQKNLESDLKVDEMLLKAGARLGERERLAHYGRPEVDPKDTPLRNPETVTERIQEPGAGKDGQNLPNQASPASLVQHAMAEAIGVYAQELAPLRDLFSQIEAKANDAGVTDEDLASFVGRAAERMPELFGSMDLSALADVLAAAEGTAVLQGITQTLRKHRTLKP